MPDSFDVLYGPTVSTSLSNTSKYRWHLPPRPIIPSLMGMPPLIPPIMGLRRAIDTFSLRPWYSFPTVQHLKKVTRYITWSIFSLDSCIRYCVQVSCAQLIKCTIKMLHSCFGTDWLLVGEGGISFGLSWVLVRVYVDGGQAKSAVNLHTKKSKYL